MSFQFQIKSSIFTILLLQFKITPTIQRLEQANSNYTDLKPCIDQESTTLNRPITHYACSDNTQCIPFSALDCETSVCTDKSDLDYCESSGQEVCRRMRLGKTHRKSDFKTVVKVKTEEQFSCYPQQSFKDSLKQLKQHWATKGFPGQNTICLHSDDVCNGAPQCANFNDEALDKCAGKTGNYTADQTCDTKLGEWGCKIKLQCIKSTKVCDGTVDCLDQCAQTAWVALP